MLDFTIHTFDSAPEQAVDLLKQVADNIGFAPNIFAATAESAPALSGLMAINSAFANSSFTAQEQQIILMATSIENGCVYCVAGHTLMAGGADLPEGVVQAMRNQQFINHPRYAILVKVVARLIASRGQVNKALVKEFLGQGYSKAQFFELVLGISVKTFTNYVSNALSLTLDDAFRPYRWDRPQALKKSA